MAKQSKGSGTLNLVLGRTQEEAEWELSFGAYLVREGHRLGVSWTFSPSEISGVGEKSHGIWLSAPPKELWRNIIPTLRLVELVKREFYDVSITSGYRDHALNKEVGGVKKSLHRSFNALDFIVEDTSPVEVKEFILDVAEGYSSVLGIGLYKSFTHLDTRGLIGRKSPKNWGA